MLPLITHSQLSDPIAYRAGVAISVAQYLADVAYCATRLPDARYVLLACQDRYAFAVGLGAAWVRQQSCLLPSTHTEELIGKLASTHEALYCLTDEHACGIQLPQTYIADWLLKAAALPALSVPMIDTDHVAAYVFTSGSTGLPVAHRKTWGRLVVNVQSEGQRLGVVPGSQYTMVGTVPPQHMYGFESTVLIAMQNAAAFESGKPFYPADIERTMARTPRPRALVTTPFHLRAFITEVAAPSPIDLLVCATAPLTATLAVEAEQKTQARLLEIYGSTETGQLATRQTSQTSDWITFDGIHIAHLDGKPFASGAQIEGSVEVNDVLELLTERVFILHGRTVDMVNVAGKSTTLGHLNHQLLSIPGVEDGAFFVPNEATEGVGNTTRLAAVVVAPTLSLETLQQALRRKIAPAFLPRPLKLVPTLPRNSTGKLPREALLAFLQTPHGPATPSTVDAP
jgi:acyl-coenzyme A synthetase/AMP-(fatty) acid ligase